jgi:hypothetical protein
MNADMLGLLEQVCDIGPLLLSPIVKEHGEKVYHHPVIELLTQKSPGSFLGTILEVYIGVTCGLLVDNLVPLVLCID